MATRLERPEANVTNDGHLVTMFDKWCMQYSALNLELAEKKSLAQQAQLSLESSEKARKDLKEECCRLQETIDHLQEQQRMLCDLEDEVRLLKMKLHEREQELSAKAQENEKNIQHMRDSLSSKYEEKIENMRLEYAKNISDLEMELTAERENKASLEKNMNDTLREKDREIAKTSMEYESKLGQAERQKAQFLQQQQQVVNQDILRKKMQHMKETYEREITQLQSQICVLKATQSTPNSLSPGQANQHSHYSRVTNPPGRRGGLSLTRSCFRGQSPQTTKPGY